MKKTLILTIALSMLLAGTASTVFAANDKAATPAVVTAEKADSGCLKGMPCPKMTRAEFEKIQKERRKEFEKRLKITKKQKQIIEANRAAEKQEMEPIKKEISAKIYKIKQIKDSNISEEQKNKQIEEVKKEIAPLKQQANDIRRKNMQEFESILTDKQKTILEEIKKERKARFYKKPCQQGPCPIPKDLK